MVNLYNINLLPDSFSLIAFILETNMRVCTECQSIIFNEEIDQATLVKGI